MTTVDEANLLWSLALRTATREETVESVRAVFTDLNARPVERMCVLHSVWCSTDRPMLQLPREEWVRMFRRVGYFEMPLGGLIGSRPQPTGAMRLYRAATPAHARGLSWTPWLPLAERYADQASVPGFGAARVYTADVPGEYLLATFRALGSVEVVVDLPDDYPVEVA